MSMAAVYFRSGFIHQEVRLMRARPDVVTEFGSARVHQETETFELRVSEIADPKAGDRIFLAEGDRIVQGVPRKDREGLVWSIDTRPA